MYKLQCLTLVFLLSISSVNSQVFMIGVLDVDLFTYINGTVYTNFTLQLVTIPQPITSLTYSTVNATLATYDVIIGRFDYTIATICQNMNLTFFFLGDFISTYPGALLEVGSDLITEAQMFLIYLNKYNINYNLRFISDSSTDSVNFRYGLGENTVSQCNFNPGDTIKSIQTCYASIFNLPKKSNFVFITDPPNVEPLLDIYIQQILYRSLTFSSMVFFPMTDILPIFTMYYYSGHTMLQITPEVTNVNQTGTLIQRKAMAAYLQTYLSLSPYTKVNITHWSLNGVITPFNKTVILGVIKSYNNVYKSNGQMTSKQYYIYAPGPQSLAMVTSFSYSQNWVESPIAPNPGIIGAKGNITIIYILDSAMLSEVSIPGGTVIQGFAVDLLNILLTPMQVSYMALKYTDQPIVGLLLSNSSTGMYGQMLTGKYSMTAFPVPVRQNYRINVTYSNEIYNIKYSMLIRIPGVTVQMLALAQPFSPLVWIVILVTIVALSAILFFTNLISPNVAESTDKLTVSNSVFMVCGSFLVAKMLVKPNMFSTQIFYLIIWLGTLLLIASYVSNLFVVTAFTNSTSVQFTTIADLYSRKNYKWAFVNDSFIYNSIRLELENNKNSTILDMFKYANNTWPNNTVIESAKVEEFALNNPDYGIINDHIHNFQISLKDCLLTTVVDTTLTIPMAYVINSSFPFVQDFANQILIQRESGAIDILLTKYFATGVCPIAIVRNGGIQAFDLQIVCGAFVFIAIGIVLSLIVAGVEYLLKKGDLQCQRFVKGNSLQFGQIYKGKVKALDKGGVTVDIGRQSCFSRENDARIYYIPKKNLIAKGKKKDEIPSPTDQGIMIGTTLYLKYLGNNPDDSRRNFIQVSKK